MEHPFMSGFTRAMNDLGFATLRFNFPYREAGRRFPDRPPVAIATWRASTSAPSLSLNSRTCCTTWASGALCTDAMSCASAGADEMVALARQHGKAVYLAIDQVPAAA